MNRISRVLLPALLAGMTCLSTGARAADNALDWAPADSEFILFLNARQLADSSLAQKFLTQIGGEQAKAMLQVFKNMTAVDLMKDLDRVCLFGRVKDDNSILIVLQGRFREDGLTTVLKANPKYTQSSHGGVTIHEWFDAKEKRMKFGAFPSEGSAVMANSRESLHALIDTKGSNKGFLTTDKAKLLPEGYKEVAAWGLLIRPERVFPDGDFKDTLQARSAAVAISLREGKVAARRAVNTDSTEASGLWLKMLQGGLALLQLQKENQDLRDLAASTKPSQDTGSNRVALDVEIGEDKLIELIQKQKGR